MVLGLSISRKGRSRLCRACGNLIGADSDECSYCGAKDRITTGLWKDPVRIFGPPGPARVITILNVVYYAIMVVASRLSGGASRGDVGGLFGIPSFYDDATFVRFGSLEPDRVLHGEYWRLVTPIFMHIGIVHLAFNSFALIQLGPTAEDLFGRSKFVVIYVASGIIGNVASVYFGIGGAGASGAIFGLLGCFVGYALRQRSRMGDAVRTYAVQAILYALLMGFLMPRVNNYAHVGGLVGGFAVAYLLGPGEPLRTREERVVRVATWATMIATLASFVMAGLTVAGAV